MAQLAKCPTLEFGSDHGMSCEIKPLIRLYAQQEGLLEISLSLSLCHPHSKINKSLKKVRNDINVDHSQTVEKEAQGGKAPKVTL